MAPLRTIAPAARRALRLIALFYFLSYGALGMLFPFLPMILAGRGLDPRQIAWVLALIPACGLLMPPLWGALADVLRARVALLRLASVGAGLALLALLPAGGFAAAAVAVAVFSLFRGPISSLADAAAYAALGGHGAGYGRVRVWGSVGFAALCLAAGQLLGSRHPRALILGSAAVYLLSTLPTFGLPAPPPQRERGVLRQVAGCLRQPAMLLFLLGNAAHYFGHAIYDGYFSLHLQALGLDDAFVSLAWAVGVAVEIAVMVLARRLLGVVRPLVLLGLCAVAAGVRWAAMTVVTTPAALLALQGLHGLSFGLWYLAMAEHVQASAPERLRTTLQAAALAAIGLGAVTGYGAGGQAFHRGRGPAAFALGVLGAAAATLCYVTAGLAGRRAGPAASPGD